MLTNLLHFEEEGFTNIQRYSEVTVVDLKPDEKELLY